MSFGLAVAKIETLFDIIVIFATINDIYNIIYHINDNYG